MSVFHPSKPNPPKPSPDKLLAPPLMHTRAMSFIVERARASRGLAALPKKEPK